MKKFFFAWAILTAFLFGAAFGSWWERPYPEIVEITITEVQK